MLCGMLESAKAGAPKPRGLFKAPFGLTLAPTLILPVWESEERPSRPGGSIPSCWACLSRPAGLFGINFTKLKLPRSSFATWKDAPTTVFKGTLKASINWSKLKLGRSDESSDFE